MTARSRMQELTNVEQTDEFLKQNPTCVLFKAGGCHKTVQGFGYVEQALNKYPKIPFGFIRVIENRPVSNFIAELTGIVHQSPQLILMLDGKPVYDVDNWNITLPDVERALSTFLAGGSAPN